MPRDLPRLGKLAEGFVLCYDENGFQIFSEMGSAGKVKDPRAGYCR